MTSFKESAALFLVRALGVLPLPIARAVGRFVGRISWRLQDRNSKITRENLRICFPSLEDKEREVLAKQSMLATGALAAETFVIWHRNNRWRDRHVKRIYGEQNMFDAVNAGKGVILLAPHIGNWEFLGARLSKYGHVTCLYQPPKKPYLEQFVVKNRKQVGMTSAPTNRKGVAQLLAALKEKGVLGILPDQCPDQGGEFSPFFGTPAYTMTLVHGLIKRTGCRVVAGVAQRVKGGFELHYLPPPDAIYSADVAESLAAMNQAVEQCVAICPEQYQWEYKRFKLEPGGVRTHYQF